MQYHLMFPIPSCNICFLNCMRYRNIGISNNKQMASGQLAKQQRASSAPSTGRDHDGHQTLTGTVSVQKTRAKFEQPTTSPPPKPLKKPKSKKNKLLHNFCDSLRNEVKDWTGQAKKSIPKPSVDLKEKDIQSTESLINRLESICKTNKVSTIYKM